MTFASSFWLWFLIFIPIIYALIILDERGKQKKFSNFIAPSLWGRIVPEIDWGAKLKKSAFLMAGLFFCVVALARPQWGSHEETTTALGLDLMVSLDVSNSMDCEDVVPSRLKKSKHLIKALLEKLSGDRVGIVAFAGSAYVAVPLTSDLDYVWEIVQNLSPQLIQNQGTDIGLGLETAQRALERGAAESDTPPGADAQSSSKAILLVSDGEDHEDQAITHARALAQAGIQFYAIGVGTQKGAPVPVKDDSGNTLTYKKNPNGEPVISKFMPDALMEVARAAKGQYFSATLGEQEVDEVVKSLGSLTRSELAERKYSVKEDRFQYPLGLALLFLFLEVATAGKKYCLRA